MLNETTTRVPGPVFLPRDVVKEIIDAYRACVFPFILVLGIVGNVLSLIIFPRLKRRDKSTSQYLTILAASDLVNLLTNGLVDSWMHNALKDFTGRRVYYDFLASHEVVCKTFRYLWYISSATSTWTLMLFNVEKCIAIHFPLRRDRLFTSRRRQLAIIAILIIAMITRSPFPYSYTKIKNKGCLLIFTSFSGVGTIILIVFELATTFLIPCCVVVISNVIIGVTLIRSRLNQNDKTAIQKHGGTADYKSYKFLVNLISVSVLFLVTVTPACILWSMFWIRILIFTLYGSGPQFSVLYYALLSTNIQDLNFCLNFLVYIACLSFYQQEARKLLCRLCITKILIEHRFN